MRQNGNGLINMQRRINLLKGTMNIKSADGVTVEFSVPLS
jgi:signal transduction histidine kinase